MVPGDKHCYMDSAGAAATVQKEVVWAKNKALWWKLRMMVGSKHILDMKPNFAQAGKKFALLA